MKKMYDLWKSDYSENVNAYPHNMHFSPKYGGYTFLGTMEHEGNSLLAYETKEGKKAYICFG